MPDQTAAKVAAASGVFVVGILIALLFRHEAPPKGPPAEQDEGRLILRRTTGTVAPAATAGGTAASPSTSAIGAQPDSSQTIFLAPPPPVAAPPLIARDYPGSRDLPAERWATAVGADLADGEPPPERSVHTIVDGDTLEDLAERYLGNANRYLEIYEANRDVLASPQVLPIGAELKIPPRRRLSHPPTASTSQPPAASTSEPPAASTSRPPTASTSRPSTPGTPTAGETVSPWPAADSRRPLVPISVPGRQ